MKRDSRPRKRSQTLFEQIDLISWYLKPVFRKIIEFINSKPVNEADDTTWKNLGPKGDGDPQKFYLWAVLNDQAACFNVYNARNQKVAKNFLGQLEGHLVTDGHNSFKGLGGINSKLILPNDWCHARRRFKEASKNYGTEAKAFLTAINRLFAIEDEIRDGSPADRHQVRREKPKLVVEAIRKLLDETACLPQSSLGRAITYTDQLWEGLIVFLSDPRVPIHTNSVERALRSPAVGRKNNQVSKNLVTASVAFHLVFGAHDLQTQWGRAAGLSHRDYPQYLVKEALSDALRVNGCEILASAFL